MADKRIQDLTQASSIQLNDLFVLEQSGAAKSLSGQTLVTDLATYLNGHGGISDITYTPPTPPSLDGTLTITMADASTYSVTVTNGNGIDNIGIEYGISTSGTDPVYVSSWSLTPVAPTDAQPFGWTKYTITTTDGSTAYAYSVTVKAADPSVTVGSVTAVSGATPGANIVNSGTATDPILDFTFTLPKGDTGDTGDYIEPVVSYGTSTAAGTEPVTWYSSPTSISYSAGNFIWKKTEYTLHDAQTVQSTVKEIIGYIGQNGAGSGTVTQITFNGTVYADDGTGNVPMSIDAADVGAIEDPSTKSNGQVLTYDSTAQAWVAATPSAGNVNTVNNKGVDVGTTNITIYATDIKMSSSDNTTVNSAIPTMASIVNLVYPVGSLYWSSQATDPGTLFGVGTWTRVKDTFILAAGDTYSAGSTGGAATHTLTVSEMPSHNHGSKSLTGSIPVRNAGSNGSSGIIGSGTGILSKGTYTSQWGGPCQQMSGNNNYPALLQVDATHTHTSNGGGEAHNNMPPYKVYYCWERTA